MIAARAIGAPLDRIDGPLKVAGAAKYAAEYPVENLAHVFVVQSTIAKGRVTSIDTARARAIAGVVAVLTHENAPRIAECDDAALRVLQSDAVAYHGQIVAAVVAETPEVARQAAGLVAVTYEEQPHHVELRADDQTLYKPGQRGLRHRLADRRSRRRVRLGRVHARGDVHHAALPQQPARTARDDRGLERRRRHPARREPRPARNSR